MRQGDICDRVDPIDGLVLRVCVASNDLFNDATGAVFVCPVLTGQTGDDYYTTLVTFGTGNSISGVIVPDLVYRMPISGLTQPLVRLNSDESQRVRTIIHGMFS